MSKSAQCLWSCAENNHEETEVCCGNLAIERVHFCGDPESSTFFQRHGNHLQNNTSKLVKIKLRSKGPNSCITLQEWHHKCENRLART